MAGKYRRSIISVGSPTSQQVSLSVNGGTYDYSKSTEQNYCIAADVTPEFVGKYAFERSQLDYAYHRYYTEERQLLHDRLIDLFLETVVYDGDYTCECPLNPWLVFTAGCMGAGKGHTIEYLYEHDLFPLNAFVRVDPDLFRELLPETKEYISRNARTAGSFTQKEVGYISEVITMHALLLGKNVLCDGSLKNAGWYTDYISNIRSKFTNVSIAIIYVTAGNDTIMHRASERANTTGRVVPDDIILDTLEQLPSSIGTLSPVVDYMAVFINECEPSLLYSSTHDDAGKLQSFLTLNSEDRLHSLKLSNEVCRRNDASWFDDFRSVWLMKCPI